MSNLKDNISHLNEENSNTFGTLMRIIEYNNTNDIVVEFQDKYKFQKKTNYTNFKMGRVKNPYDKTVFGVGCLGYGQYKSWRDSKGSTKTYLAWINMLQRCYADMNNKYASYYKIVTVCDEWLDFQNFAEWYESHYYDIPNERLHIDKDIKSKENKVYSPDTCILIPQSINEVFRKNNRKKIDADLPETIKRSGEEYQVTFRGESLGTYKTIEECLEKYNSKKILYIKELVEEYKSLLPNEVADILLQWQP